MRAGLLRPIATIMATTLLAACSVLPTPGPSASTTPSPGTTVTATVTATPTPSASPSPGGSASAGPSTAASSPDTCQPFGTTAASASSPDWASDLRTAPGDALWGVTMRVGAHDCFDRWVLELTGDGGMPGWSVTPHAASTFAADGSGADIPPLAGAAALEVSLGAWYDGTPLGEDPYTGPRTLTPGGAAIQEARIVGAFEGITQVGIGLDRERPYRVTWLDGPPRLVVDVFTG